MERVYISKTAEESIESGHLWIFSNEIVERPQEVTPGNVIQVFARGRFMGIGYINPQSLIMVRLLAREDTTVNEYFFESRIRRALALRDAAGLGNSFRVANSESDFLPGLVIDKYEEYLVVQILTSGMERFRDEIVAAVKRIFAPKAIVLRADNPYRSEESLPLYTAVVHGSLEDEVAINVGSLKFLVNLLSGHKTGFYFDQRDNRSLLQKYVKGARVLDLFSYTCGFGLYACLGQAKSVTCVDSSESALELGKRNMKLNGLSSIDFVKQDCFEFLRRTEFSYDVIVLDPPSFIKSKRKIREGEKGYIDLHKKTLRKINDEGYIFTFSCSHHMPKARFRDLIRTAAYGYADLYLLKELSQAADHPVVVNIPETEYLKGMALQVRKR